MLTAEARERMEDALAVSPDRPRVTVRRDDVRTLIEGQEGAAKAAYLAGYETGDRDRAAMTVAPAAPLALEPATPSWPSLMGQWTGALIALASACGFGWVWGHGLL